MSVYPSVHQTELPTKQTNRCHFKYHRIEIRFRNGETATSDTLSLSLWFSLHARTQNTVKPDRTDDDNAYNLSHNHNRMCI